MIAALLAVLALGLLILVAVTWIARRRSGIDRAAFQERWDGIRALAQQSEAHWTVAVMEADKLLDEALKKLRFNGKTTGERLASAGRSLGDPDLVWKAHKIRNMVVHENVKLTKKHVSLALRGFRSALKDLDVL